MSTEDGERAARPGEPDAAFSQEASGDGVAGEGLGEMEGCTMKRSQDKLSSSVGGISGIA